MNQRYEFWEDDSGKLIPYPTRRVTDNATERGGDLHQLGFQEAVVRLNEQDRIIASLVAWMTDTGWNKHACSPEKVAEIVAKAKEQP